MTNHRHSLIAIALILTVNLGYGQQLPYREIPPAPASYTAGTVTSRLVDGLGFRFYWATEGLRPEDLAFKPGADARTSAETVRHIFELSTIVVNAVNHVANETAPPQMSFEKMRELTLKNLKEASDKLRSSSDKDMESYVMVFRRGNNKTEFPFWNEINGPIADALWHVGQVVSFRRSSGNPFNSKVSVLTGTVME